MTDKRINLENIPKEKFALAGENRRITDTKFETKPVGYFKDAFNRFKKNKSSLVAAIIILLLFLFALIVPFFSNYNVTFRDGYYKMLLPKSKLFSFLGWDGCSWYTVSQAGYDSYSAIGYEYGGSAVRKASEPMVEEGTGKTYYKIYLDSYEKVGFAYVDLTEDEFIALKDYQNSTGIQVCYPIPENYKMSYQSVANGANLWYKLADTSNTTTGAALRHDENGMPIFENNYIIKDNPTYGRYDSLRIPGDDGGKNGKSWYVYSIKNQTGYRVRVLYSEYYKYKNGFEANHLFGTNQHGQDIFVCLAMGARLSFILAISVSIINFIIGVSYGSV
ncbi:MAG: hypothetical protein II962_02170, partial [Spirochaetales bacterium]|nr:hypothetical protein [Spirochaetales bacterium]